MSDTLIIIVAVLAVLAVGFQLFRSASTKQTETLPPGEEGNGISDGFAAATEDVVGDLVGVEANPDTPGDTRVRQEEDGSGAVASTARGGAGDDLQRIKGLGPKIAGQLNAMGIARYEQIAGWSDGDIEAIANSAGRPQLAERVRRDRWVEQAGLLARGETAAFEETFGKLG